MTFLRMPEQQIALKDLKPSSFSNDGTTSAADIMGTKLVYLLRSHSLMWSHQNSVGKSSGFGYLLILVSE